jgi:alkylation response protein AidB-like acyl-CoA dehydrogenase
MRGFRTREIEALWEQLDGPARAPFEELWQGLCEVSVPSIGLPEELGGLSLAAQAELDVAIELGAGCPALAVSLLLHRSALTLLHDAARAKVGLPQELAAAGDARFSLLASPLAAVPDTAFTLQHNGAVLVSGSARVVLPHASWLVLPARKDETLKLVVLDARADGVQFRLVPSSHGLRLLPFGQLTLDHAAVSAVFDWPRTGHAARRADGLLTGILCGMLREMTERAMRYARERYQGGKLIHEHDTIREMVGPMLLAQRALHALALDALQGEPLDGVDGVDGADGAGAAAAFAVERVRSAGLDAIQVFGGYGYMEDYRVERYLRDANTLETFFIHASAVARAVAAARFASLSV